MFINNSNITEMYLANDDLNLKESGKRLLANNFTYGMSRILWNDEACNGCYGLQNKTSKSSDTKWDLSKNSETQSKNEKNCVIERELNKLRLSNANNAIVGHSNKNSLPGKIDHLKRLITNKTDILID